MADAGSREIGGDLPIDAIAQADEDARGEPGLGLGQDPGQQLPGVTTPALEERARIGRPPQHVHRPSVEGAPRTEPLEVSTVRAVGARPGPPLHGHPITRLDRRVARQRGGQPETARAAGHGTDRRDLLALARRSDGLDERRPRPAAHRRTRRAHSGRADSRPQRDRQDPDRQRKKPDAPAVRQPQRRRGTGGRPPPPARPRVDGRRPRPSARRSSLRPRASRSATPQRTVTSSRNFSNVFSPRTPRVRSSSTAAKGASSRAAMIFSARRGTDPGQRLELGLGRVVEVEGRAGGRGRLAGHRRRARGRAARGVIARGNPHLVAVMQGGREIELPPGPGRIDARAVSACGRHEVADTRARRKVEHPGSRDRTDDLDDEGAVSRSPDARAGRAQRVGSAGRTGQRQRRTAVHGHGPVRSVRERQDEGHHRTRDRRPDRGDDLQEGRRQQRRRRLTRSRGRLGGHARVVCRSIKHSPRGRRGRFHIGLRGGRS